jgi:hypothetical protein
MQPEDDQADEDDKECLARHDRSQAETAVRLGLGQQVAKRCAERPGQDVSDPERQYVAETQLVVQPRDQRNEPANKSPEYR